MPWFLSCFVVLLVGGGLRTTSQRTWHPFGIALLIACIPAFIITFLTQYGVQSLLVSGQALPFLALPLFLIGVALILPMAAQSTKRLRYFAIGYGLFLLAWCVTLVITNPPWSSQVLGR